MSTSAVDHYNVWEAIDDCDDQHDELYRRQDIVQDLQEEILGLEDRLDAARLELAQAEIDCAEQRTTVSKAKEKANAMEAIADTITSSDTIVVDPITGLPQDDKVLIARKEHEEWLLLMNSVRDHLEAGDLEKARDLERQASELQKTMNLLVNFHGVGLPSAFQVNAARFVQPRSTVTDEELAKTLDYAKKNEGEFPGCAWSRHMAMEIFDKLKLYPKLTKGVNPQILSEITEHREALIQSHGKPSSDHEEDEESGEDDDDNDTENENEREFEMHRGAWQAIEKAVRNGIDRKMIANKEEILLPRPNSAPIARYNQNGHFAFQSEEANSSVDSLTDALCCCTLRSFPPNRQREQRVRRPLEVNSLDIECLDIDGDMMAMCGDIYSDLLRDSKAYVGHRTVPRLPVNLDTANSRYELKDAEGNTFDHESDSTIKVFESRKTYFMGIVADAGSQRIWASSCFGAVYGFTTVGNGNQRNSMVARLLFDEPERNSQKESFSAYKIAKCGERIVGSAGTGRLSVWNVHAAEEEYLAYSQAKVANEKTDEQGDEERMSASKSEVEIRMENTDEGPNKRQKIEKRYRGMGPNILKVEEDGFLCGEIQTLGKKSSHILVAPKRGLGSCSKSIRLYDLAAESVVGLFAGNQDDVAIEKQYCVDSHHLIFTADMGANYCTGFVWDVRSFRPAFVLHTDRKKGRILGVPANSPVAFTFDDGSESVSCWDLRMPASHAYTMATGNTDVTSLFWHEETTSLIATSRSKHTPTYGNNGEYLYGERIDPEDEVEHIGIVDGWPSRANHEPIYFGTDPWHVSYSQLYRPFLQYAFEHV